MKQNVYLYLITENPKILFPTLPAFLTSVLFS